MAITIDDFDKVWASQSPLTPYEFSESQYKEGWNFVGATPPSRQMWDFLQKNNDEKMQYLADNYLPLSGGTMSGAITSSVGNFLKFITDGGVLRILGGTDLAKGSAITLTGKDLSGWNGKFQIQAHNGSQAAALEGNPDGKLTWNEYDITPYRKKGNAPSITVPEGTYILVAFSYGFSVPSQTAVYVGLIGGGDYNDGTQHIGIVDILKGSNFANLGLSYSITTDNTRQITVSLTSNNSSISLIKVTQ